MRGRPPSDALPPTERRNPRTADLDCWDALTIVQAMHREDRRAVAAVGKVLDRVARAAEWAAEVLAAGGRWIYAGAGTSGRMAAMDAAELGPTFGLEPGRAVALIAGGAEALVRAVEGAEDDRAAGTRDAREAGVSGRDLVLLLAAGGRTPYTLGVLDAARAAGARTVAVTADPESPLAAAADLAICPAVGPEVLAGSTRLKAGTAQKLVLNMISTAAMVRSGKVYGNWMVDLTPGSAKLRGRAVRIVAEAAGVDAERARRALEACGWSVKVATVAARLGIDPGAARTRLREAGGWVRAALGETSRSPS